MNYHLIGIGGIGMSGLAKLLSSRGHRVSGSDARSSETLRELAGLGIDTRVGHAADQLGNPDIVVISAAIAEDNPEVREARRRGIPVEARSVLFARLFAEKPRGIAVAGSHGKTTTTAMIAHALIRGGFDPSVLLGGKLESVPGNARWGASDLFVAEADESDGTLLHIRPELSILTSVDNEHLEAYGDRGDLETAYLTFLKHASQGMICLDACPEEMLKKALKYDQKIITYGFHQAARYRAEVLEQSGMRQRFQVIDSGEALEIVEIQLPGQHNLLNSLAALAALRQAGMELPQIIRALADFQGLGRRFQVLGRAQGIAVVDDYAHHPTEIRATLRAARQVWPEGRLFAVLQPHRYTRLRDLWREFVHCLELADVAVLTEVYAASETPIDGIDSRCLVRDIRRAFPDKTLHDADGLEAAGEYLLQQLRPGDAVLLLGAGSITQLAHQLAEKLKA